MSQKQHLKRKCRPFSNSFTGRFYRKFCT